jgi:hypothetical protein
MTDLIPFEISGLNKWDVEALEQALAAAKAAENLSAHDIVVDKQSGTTDPGTHVHEPGAIDLAIAIVHYVIPSVAAVVVAWLKTRPQPQRITIRVGDSNAPVPVTELATKLKGFSR